MSRTLIQEGLIALKEVFNRPYPVRRDSLSYADIYTAHTEDGREIYINIELRDADDVSLKAFDSFNPMIAKDFGWNPNHVIGKIDFSVDDSTSITGEGDAPRILATVVEAIRLSMSTNRNLVGFMFWGFGLSRSRLYRTMVRRLGRQYNMDVVKSKNVEKVDGEFLLLADAKRARYMFTKEVFEDIGPKTSKQSIRPYMKNAVRGLNEAPQGAGARLNSPLTMVRPGSSLAPGNFFQMRMPFRNKGVETSKGRRFIGTGSSESSRSMLQRPNVNPRTSEGSTREAIKQTRNPDYDAAEIQKQRGTVGDSTSIRADTGRAKSPEKPRGNNPEDIPGLGGDIDGRYIPMLAKPDVMYTRHFKNKLNAGNIAAHLTLDPGTPGYEVAVAYGPDSQSNDRTPPLMHRQPPPRK